MLRALLWTLRALVRSNSGEILGVVAQGAPGSHCGQLLHQLQNQMPDPYTCDTAAFTDAEANEHFGEPICIDVRI